jgi:hypothetical protein
MKNILFITLAIFIISCSKSEIKNTKQIRIELYSAADSVQLRYTTPEKDTVTILHQIPNEVYSKKFEHVYKIGDTIFMDIKVLKKVTAMQYSISAKALWYEDGEMTSPNNNIGSFGSYGYYDKIQCVVNQ